MHTVKHCTTITHHIINSIHANNITLHEYNNCYESFLVPLCRLALKVTKASAVWLSDTPY